MLPNKKELRNMETQKKKVNSSASFQFIPEELNPSSSPFISPPFHQQSTERPLNLNFSNRPKSTTSSKPLIYNPNIYQFYINSQKLNKDLHFKNNKIDTTKYNIFTFLPKALLFQFLRLANIYFLIIAIIQCIPIISPLGKTTAILPLVFVLVVSLIREAYEDCQRASLDNEQNSEPVEVYREGKWIATKSGDLLIGEVVEVKKDASFPADLVLIDSNLPEGVCFIETGTLDGEKTLKLKTSPSYTKGKFNSNNNFNINSNNSNSNSNSNNNNNSNNNINSNSNNNSNNNNNINDNANKIECFSIEGTAQCDKPNPELYQLNGKMNLIFNNEQFNFPLDSKQLLLKGAKLRNTEWCIGIVIYTGHNCKLLKNAKNPLVKFSSVEKLMSKLLIAILILQCSLSIVSAILHGYYYKKNVKINYFIDYDDLSFTSDCVLNFFTYLLLLNTMIPISLVVTLEIVKVIQGLFIRVDANGYSPVRKKLILPNCVSLNEELGMVNYIFTDKTGTLTCNRMALKFCVIADVCYELNRNDAEDNKLLRENEDIVLFEQFDMLNFSNGNSKKFNVTNYKDYTIESMDRRCKIKLTDTKKVVYEFWNALALCHDCSVQNGEYIGMSPDSIELVKTAKAQGFKFVESNSNAKYTIELSNDDSNSLPSLTKKVMDKLNIIEFSSDRKRESVIVRDGDLIKLYIKGADSVIEERLSDKTPSEVLDRCKHFVDMFSADGYRTLFIGMRLLSESEYKTFATTLEQAQMDTENKKEKVAEAFAMVEKDITLIGATIVEDKLQDSVPETIKELRTAEIKIWMLTGDKMNTAYNIGLSCNLISMDMKTFFIKGVEQEKDEHLRVINNDERQKVIIDFGKEYHSFKGNFDSLAHPQFAIVVDEKALLTITESDEMTNIFLNIAKDAVAVICCRVSPLQKSQVVKMMKHFDSSKITLAIGDGGNDVSMIMEAHIGIGIYGEEGMRAVQSSDYAIGEFKILRELLLFHGYISLMRNSDMIIYFFYKNFVFTLIHFTYGFYNNFSGQTIIDDWFITMFNLVFTSLPLGVRAILDIDLRPSDGKLVNKVMPYLYLEGRDKPIFTKLSFILNLLIGVFHACINFFICIYSVNDSNIDNEGNIADLWYISVNMYSNIILIVSINLMIFTKYHTFLNFIIMFVFTFGLYTAFVVLVHYWSMFNSNGTMYVAFTSSKIWVSIVFVVGTCMILDMVVLGVRNLFEVNLRNTIKVAKDKNAESLEEFDKLVQMEDERMQNIRPKEKRIEKKKEDDVKVYSETKILNDENDRVNNGNQKVSDGNEKVNEGTETNNDGKEKVKKKKKKKKKKKDKGKEKEKKDNNYDIEELVLNSINNHPADDNNSQQAHYKESYYRSENRRNSRMFMF